MPFKVNKAAVLAVVVTVCANLDPASAVDMTLLATITAAAATVSTMTIAQKRAHSQNCFNCFLSLTPTDWTRPTTIHDLRDIGASAEAASETVGRYVLRLGWEINQFYPAHFGDPGAAECRSVTPDPGGRFLLNTQPVCTYDFSRGCTDDENTTWRILNHYPDRKESCVKCMAHQKAFSCECYKQLQVCTPLQTINARQS